MQRITVAIVAHNEALRIEACLKSVFRQDYPHSQIHILVIDNASSDATAKLALAALKLGWDGSWQLLRRDENHLGQARAAAIELAQGSYLAFLDADCEAPTTWLSDCWRAFSRLNSHEKVGAVSPTLAFPQGESLFAIARASLNSNPLAHLGSPQAATRAEGQRVEHLPTACVLLSRDAALAAGSFSPHLARVCEDVEFSVRLRKAGFSLFQLATPPVLHRQQEGWTQWVKRMWAYGFGQTLARGPWPWRWPERLWPVWLFYPLAIFLLVFAPLYFGMGAVFYGSLIGILAWRALPGVKRLSHAAAGCALVLLTHLTYSLAFLMGWVTSLALYSRLKLVSPGSAVR